MLKIHCRSEIENCNLLWICREKIKPETQLISERKEWKRKKKEKTNVKFRAMKRRTKVQIQYFSKSQFRYMRRFSIGKRCIWNVITCVCWHNPKSAPNASKSWGQKSVNFISYFHVAWISMDTLPESIFILMIPDPELCPCHSSSQLWSYSFDSDKETNRISFLFNICEALDVK